MIHSQLLRQAALFLIVLLFANASHAQTTPPDGIRKNTPTVHAFTNARIVQSPGKVIEKGTLVIRDGVISSVGDFAQGDECRHIRPRTRD
jgi:hypothetical protein